MGTRQDCAKVENNLAHRGWGGEYFSVFHFLDNCPGSLVRFERSAWWDGGTKAPGKHGGLGTHAKGPGGSGSRLVRPA
jgi:hypothetical protein